MKKATSIMLVTAILYAAPLIAQPVYVLTWPISTLALVCILLFATQPPVSLKESREHKATDAWTIWLILGVSALGQVVNVVEWAYFRGAPQTLDAWALTGLVLLVFGTSFRLWAIRTLKSNFAATVQIKQGQQLVTSGPYRWLRHPSYTGAWLAMLGSALLLKSYLGSVLLGPGMLLVYRQRIAVEERALEQAFGEEYTNMKLNTSRLVPGVW